MYLLLLLSALPAADAPALPKPEAIKQEVIVFLAAECPMAKLYAGRLNDMAARHPRVQFRGISIHPDESPEKIAEFQQNLHFDFRHDPELRLRLRATRSPEVFYLVDDRVAYHGRIDDQYSPGFNMSMPRRHDLEEAIVEVAHGNEVSVPETVATGCLFELPQDHQDAAVTFDDIAPILHRRCTECHRPGEVAPFSLITYREALAWKGMIREVVGNKRMPPWHASLEHGTFANDRSLSEEEWSTLLKWDGAPGRELNAPPVFKSGWSIKPDLVLEVAEPFTVPSEGVLDYQEFVLDPQLTQDKWVQAVEIRPGNRAVVHHINVYLRPKGAEKGMIFTNEMEDGYLAMTVPGNTVTDWPRGIAKRMPAGFEVVLSVHYQPNGTVQQDRSSIAFEFAEPTTVRQQVATRVLLKEDLKIAPRSIETAVKEWQLDQDYTLYALYPHMHLRGRSMRFEVVGGPILLDVPKFDFNWQHRYVLAHPMKLKKGSVIRCTAVFDNTEANPNNPNPGATVIHGRQSTDEMFQACLEVVRTHEDRLKESASLFPILSVIGVFCLWCVGKGR
jgi:hypothetical protein